MTPFARLGMMEKAAYQVPPSGYDYQVNANSGLRDPYAAYKPTAPKTSSASEFVSRVLPMTGLAGVAWRAAAPPKPENEGWTWGDTGGLVADVAAGSNPFTGVPYYGIKAVRNIADGNYWGALGNVGWGALSFLPGAASAAKGVVGGGAKAMTKMTPAAVRGLQTGGKLTPAMSKGIAAGGVTAGAAGGIGEMMTPGSTDPQAAHAYTTPTTPTNALHRTMTNAVVNNGVPPPPAPGTAEHAFGAQSGNPYFR